MEIIKIMSHFLRQTHPIFLPSSPSNQVSKKDSFHNLSFSVDKEFVSDRNKLYFEQNQFDSPDKANLSVRRGTESGGPLKGKRWPNCRSIDLWEFRFLFRVKGGDVFRYFKFFLNIPRDLKRRISLERRWFSLLWFEVCVFNF